jgi:hypothetical protein
MVEACHQPIPAENDPSDQESDVHLGSPSFWQYWLDEPWCNAVLAYTPLMA